MSWIKETRRTTFLLPLEEALSLQGAQGRGHGGRRPREWRQDGALSRMVGMVLLAWNPSAATNYLCCILGLITYPPVPGDHIH